jgi:hypothetical protein
VVFRTIPLRRVTDRCSGSFGGFVHHRPLTFRPGDPAAVFENVQVARENPGNDPFYAVVARRP